MTALIILAVAILWAGIGFVLWKALVQPHIGSRWVLAITTLALVAVWFVAPVLDEILGAYEFERFCHEMPENKFYGTVAVGPGEFFDESGRPKWNNIEELLSIIRGSNTSFANSAVSMAGDFRSAARRRNWRTRSANRSPSPCRTEHHG